jgi:hypothetical protein
VICFYQKHYNKRITKKEPVVEKEEDVPDDWSKLFTKKLGRQPLIQLNDGLKIGRWLRCKTKSRKLYFFQVTENDDKTGFYIWRHKVEVTYDKKTNCTFKPMIETKDSQKYIWTRYTKVVFDQDSVNGERIAITKLRRPGTKALTSLKLTRPTIAETGMSTNKDFSDEDIESIRAYLRQNRGHRNLFSGYHDRTKCDSRKDLGEILAKHYYIAFKQQCLHAMESFADYRVQNKR